MPLSTDKTGRQRQSCWTPRCRSSVPRVILRPSVDDTLLWPLASPRAPSSTTSRARTSSALAAADYWSKSPGHCLPMRLITIMPIRSIASSLISSSANLFSKALVSEFTCLVGTMVQEIYETALAIRKRLRPQHQRSCRHAGSRYRRSDALARAMSARMDHQITRAPHPSRSPRRFILAKAKGGRRSRRKCRSPYPVSEAVVRTGENREPQVKPGQKEKDP